MDGFRFVAVVWGGEFTDAFLNVCLPSLLTPGNLGFVAEKTKSCFYIYTTPRDAKAVRESPAFRQLATMMSVKIAEVRGLSFFSKYQAMTQCHAHFISAAQGEDCPFVFVSPDIVLADGAFVRLADIAESGKRLVAIGAVRLLKETFVPAYLHQYREGDVVRPISPRQLVALALEHLHPITVSCFWDPKDQQGATPLDLLWRVEQEGLLLRQFHPCPLMVWPVDKDAVPVCTIDADYTRKAVPDPSDVYIVEDSDDMCLMDFTSARQLQDLSAHGGGHSVEHVAAWARENTHEIHRECVKHRIRFHWADCSQKWAEVEESSDSVVAEILSLTEERSASVEPVKLSRMGYFSPLFLYRKFRQKGAIGFLKHTCAMLVLPVIRRLYGGTVKITLA